MKLNEKCRSRKNGLPKEKHRDAEMGQFNQRRGSGGGCGTLRILSKLWKKKKTKGEYSWGGKKTQTTTSNTPHQKGKGVVGVFLSTKEKKRSVGQGTAKRK